MRKNYVLIDYENVQPKNLELLRGHDFEVLVFVGASQKSVPVELAVALQPFGETGQYVRISGNGPNALDFHIAYYVGKLATEQPDGYFHIISKDTGFDPLIHHLRARKVRIERTRDIAEMPLLQIGNAATTEEKLEAVVASLTSRGQSRPRKVKTLSNTINALFKKALSEQERASLIAALRKRKLIEIDGDKVTYRPPITQ